jgi:hypothetical protein
MMMQGLNIGAVEIDPAGAMFVMFGTVTKLQFVRRGGVTQMQVYALAWQEEFLEFDDLHVPEPGGDPQALPGE